MTLTCSHCSTFSLAVQTLMSAGSQGYVEKEVSAETWRAVLNAAVRWDTESTMEPNPLILIETRLPVKVKSCELDLT